MVGPILSKSLCRRLRRKGWFMRIATDADLNRPDKRLRIADETLHCAECEEMVEFKRTADERFVWCENCQLLEGDTFTVGPACDDCDCSHGPDGATPTRCRQCRVREGLGV